MPPPPPSTPENPPRGAALRLLRGATYFATGSATLFGLCGAYFELVQAPHLRHGLGDALTDAAYAEARSILALGTLLLLLPGWLLTSLAESRERTDASGAWRAHLLAALAPWLSLGLLLVDSSLYWSVGRHLSDVIDYLSVPEGHQAAGNWGLWGSAWLTSFALAALVVGGVMTISALVTRRVVFFATRWSSGTHPRSSGRSSGGRLRLAAAALLGIALLIPSLAFFVHTRAFTLDVGLRSRVLDAMALELTQSAGAVTSSSGKYTRLAAALEETYARHFARLHRVTAPSVPALGASAVDAPARPHVVFIVAESFRADILNPVDMPRLDALSARAHRFTRHRAGTHSSEAGMYSLLYGRSHLTYHETLDHHVPPLLFTWLRSLGYEVGYYTGHPITWLRREEFLSKESVDRFVHDDTGDWIDWDRRALASMVAHVKEATRPTFSLVFLMSSHFEYRYPPAYELHRPVANSKFGVSEVTALGPDDRIPHLNRYRNAARFLDDLVSDALAELDDDALVVFTGDHGESFYEGGLYGHGFAFSEPVLRVPMIVRFPERSGLEARFVGPRVIEDPTLHRDVIGWIASYLAGDALYLDGFQGIANFERAAERTAELAVYASPRRKLAYALLQIGAARDLQLGLALGLEAPTVRIQGFLDDDGRTIADPTLGARDEARIRAALDAELAAASGLSPRWNDAHLR